MARYKYTSFLYDTCVHSFHDGCYCDRYHCDYSRCSRCSWYVNDGTYEDYDDYCDARAEWDDFDWEYYEQNGCDYDDD